MRGVGRRTRRRPPPPDVSVVTAGHDVADARLHREVAALQRQGLRVQVLGLGDPAAGPAGADVRARPRPGLAGRALLAARLPWLARGAVLVAPDPDVALAAVLTRPLHRRAVVADVHEDYAALLRDRAWAAGPVGVLARLVVGAATAAAAHADLTVVADEHVPPARARRRVVQRNLPDPATLPAPTDPAARPRAVYVGDLRRSRGLFAMLDALERAPGWTLDLVGAVAPSDSAELERRCSGELGGRVRVHGRLPPRQAWEVASGAWAGLALLADTPAFRDAVPTKLGEYLACGVPVVVTDLPRMRAVVDATRAGVVVPPATAAERTGDVLAGWGRDRAAYARCLAAARAAAEQQRAEEPYAPFARAVAEVLKVSRRRR